MTGNVSNRRLANMLSWIDMPIERLSPQVGRRFITGEHLMLAQVFLEAGCVVPKHSHLNEQMSYILEGELHLEVGENGEQTLTARAGDVIHVPSAVPHKVTAVQRTLSVDLFSPPRQDWIDKTDAYLRG